MRIDKYLGNLGVVPRRQIKKLLKTWEVLLNNQVVDNPQIKIKEWDVLSIYQDIIPVKFDIHILLHKPKGYVSSNVDEWEYISYKELLMDCPYGELVEIAGRLDTDTEGLLFCSSDGKVVHNIIHPHKKVEKEYYIRAAKFISDKDIGLLERGVTITWWHYTAPAQVTRIGKKEIQLTITEGKFHQVKLMLEAIGNEVVYLRRDRIGSYVLGDLEIGKWKYTEIK